MFEFIDSYCPNSKNLLANQLKLAKFKLQSGPIIFGESHDKPQARAVICELIRAGLVQRLFLEMGDLDIGLSNLLSSGLRPNMAINDTWSKFKFVFKYLDEKHGNPIGFLGLIPYAVEMGVQIFFYDNPTSEEALKNPASQLGMMNRNEESGKIFQNNNGNAPGSVALIGGAHLYPIDSGGLYNYTLQAQSNVSFDRAIDLSKMK